MCDEIEVVRRPGQNLRLDQRRISDAGNLIFIFETRFQRSYFRAKKGAELDLLETGDYECQIDLVHTSSGPFISDYKSKKDAVTEKNLNLVSKYFYLFGWNYFYLFLYFLL